MSISEWMKEHKSMNLGSLKKRRLSNEEWNKICQQYENYCSSRKIKPEYK